MEKFRKLVDQFFCTPNIALYVFFAVMLSLSIGIVVKHAHVAKPAHAAQGPRNLPDGNTHLAVEKCTSL